MESFAKSSQRLSDPHLNAVLAPPEHGDKSLSLSPGIVRHAQS